MTQFPLIETCLLKQPLNSLEGMGTMRGNRGLDEGKSYSQRRACDPQLLVTTRAVRRSTRVTPAPASHCALQPVAVTADPQSQAQTRKARPRPNTHPSQVHAGAAAASPAACHRAPSRGYLLFMRVAGERWAAAQHERPLCV